MSRSCVSAKVARFTESVIPNDTEFARRLCREIGVAPVPGSSFYRDPRDEHRQVRFAFCRKVETLREAGRRLRRLREREAAVAR